MDISQSNYLLKALYWIKKDLYGNSISEYKAHIDPIFNKTYKIRNVMEHQYLKILSYDDFDEYEQSIDELATIISLNEFNELLIDLLRTCREAIILFGTLVNIEEKK